MELTVTEALAEIKLILKKIKAKEQFVLLHCCRQSNLRDPFENDGGTSALIQREMQGIADLQTRWINIRTAITAANLSNKLTIQDKTMTVAEWLTWKREISESSARFMQMVESAINTIRQKVQGRTDAAGQQPVDVIVSLSEKNLHEVRLAENEVLDLLDGRLSLFNATTTITLPD